MDLLEYQGKQLFARAGVAVPEGEPARDVETAVAAAERIGYPCVIKAQVQIGGRGKAGGIKVAKDVDEARTHSEAIIGMDITGPHGEGPFRVHEVWVEEASEIDAEYYASIILDRSAKKPLAILSRMGGMDVEAIAESDPDALVRLHIDPVAGLSLDEATQLAVDANIDQDVVDGVAKTMIDLLGAFSEFDATLIEVNPLIVTSDREVVALDAKVTIDNSAIFRHEELAGLDDSDDEDPQEKMAKETRPHLRQARRRRRHPRQRRRPLHVDPGRRRQRRRRLRPTSSTPVAARRPTRSSTPSRSSPPTRRSTPSSSTSSAASPAATRSPRGSSRPTRASTWTCRWSSASTAPTPRRG